MFRGRDLAYQWSRCRVHWRGESPRSQYLSVSWIVPRAFLGQVVVAEKVSEQTNPHRTPSVSAKWKVDWETQSKLDRCSNSCRWFKSKLKLQCVILSYGTLVVEIRPPAESGRGTIHPSSRRMCLFFAFFSFSLLQREGNEYEIRHPETHVLKPDSLALHFQELLFNFLSNNTTEETFRAVIETQQRLDMLRARVQQFCDTLFVIFI